VASFTPQPLYPQGNNNNNNSSSNSNKTDIFVLNPTGLTIGVLGFDSRRGLGIFLFTTASRTSLGPTQLPIQWVPWALSPGVKRPDSMIFKFRTHNVYGITVQSGIPNPEGRMKVKPMSCVVCDPSCVSWP
jgi:hypothetical protein